MEEVRRGMVGSGRAGYGRGQKEEEKEEEMEEGVEEGMMEGRREGREGHRHQIPTTTARMA